MQTPLRSIKVREDLLQNARTLAPLASYSAITNDALKLWIADQQQKQGVLRQLSEEGTPR